MSVNMAMDDSFKKPGAIPFKWETRPGVPKFKQHAPSHHLNRSYRDHPNNHSLSSQPPLKLRPPPSEFKFPIIARPEVVESGCFARGTLMLKNKNDKKNVITSKSKFDLDHGSDAETMSSRWSEPTQRSLFPLSSSYSSNQSSPCLFSDPEWVGFGLF